MNGLPKKWPRAGVKTGFLAALLPESLNAEWPCHRQGKLYPAHTPELCAQKSAAIVDNTGGDLRALRGMASELIGLQGSA